MIKEPDAFMALSCADFSSALASKAPVPGGGGAAAYVGALGVALGTMVGNLTVGKAKYADIQDEIEAMMERSEALRLRFHELVSEDALSFAPLAKAYGLPSESENEKREKAETLEAALKEACRVPLEIMRVACEAIALSAAFAEKGSRLAVSDAATGAVLCKAALYSASLNVYINTKLMNDKTAAAELNAAADDMLSEYGPKADEVFGSVLNGLVAQNAGQASV